jgi:hypothetical protein
MRPLIVITAPFYESRGTNAVLSLAFFGETFSWPRTVPMIESGASRERLQVRECRRSVPKGRFGETPNRTRETLRDAYAPHPGVGSVSIRGLARIPPACARAPFSARNDVGFGKACGLESVGDFRHLVA